MATHGRVSPLRILLDEREQENLIATVKCPSCECTGRNSTIRYMFLNLNEAIYKCETCWYPFSDFIHKDVTMNQVYRYARPVALQANPPNVNRAEPIHSNCNNNESLLDFDLDAIMYNDFADKSLSESNAFDQIVGNILNFDEHQQYCKESPTSEIFFSSLESKCISSESANDSILLPSTSKMYNDSELTQLENHPDVVVLPIQFEDNLSLTSPTKLCSEILNEITPLVRDSIELNDFKVPANPLTNAKTRKSKTIISKGSVARKLTKIPQCTSVSSGIAEINCSTELTKIERVSSRKSKSVTSGEVMQSMKNNETLPTKSKVIPLISKNRGDSGKSSIPTVKNPIVKKLNDKIEKPKKLIREEIKRKLNLCKDPMEFLNIFN